MVSRAVKQAHEKCMAYLFLLFAITVPWVHYFHVPKFLFVGNQCVREIVQARQMAVSYAADKTIFRGAKSAVNGDTVVNNVHVRVQYTYMYVHAPKLAAV